MLKDVKKKTINIVICYRLDRISRNILDFSNLIEALNKDNIGFVSIKEQFDTTTPMGRAMMYIASVFSQLERETIAERIQDNMLQLAKTGRWLGGTPPTGYKSQVVINIDSKGKQKKLFKLTPIIEEIHTVKLIYNKYIKFQSITQVEKYLLENNIRTKNGLDFKRHSIRLILQNPVYAVADKALYNYLTEYNYNIFSDITDFNGINGLLSYNKTNQHNRKSSERYRNTDEWIIAVGLHEGAISSDIWIKAQKLLEANKAKGYQRSKSSKALLSGILCCANCGSYMRPKTVQRTNAQGEQVFYYICELKEKSHKSRCITKNINGNTLDSQILSKLKNIITNNPAIDNNLNILNEEACNLMNMEKKRDIIKSIFNKILWDGEKLGIILIESYLFPQCEDSK